MAPAIEFPLKIGVTTQEPVYESTAPHEIKRYRVRRGSYDVTVVYPGRTEVLGTCDVVKTGPTTFTVRPHFKVEMPDRNVRFWGGFSVDNTGTATLDSVYLVPVMGR